jgi:N(2)-fixation sustaining protein CowN
VARIETHTQGTDDPFWAYFFKRRNATQGMRCDDQLLLSSFVNQIRELLEDRGDDEGLAWLDQLEAECF